jgi:hypothetical protein
MSLTKIELLGFCNRRFDVVDLGDGAKVRIQSLMQEEIARHNLMMLDKKGQVSQAGLMAAERLYVAMALVDDQGNRLLTDDEAGELAKLDGGVFQKIAQAARRLTDRDAVTAEAMLGN